MSEDYELQLAALGEVLKNLHAEREDLQNGIPSENPCLESYKKFETIDRLTREVLIELIDKIRVHENGNICIKFKFSDQLRKVMENIEIDQIGHPYDADTCSEYRRLINFDDDHVYFNRIDKETAFSL